MSIDRRLPEEAYITTGTVINCGYYREIAVLNHTRYASANISPSKDRARDNGFSQMHRSVDVPFEYLCDADNESL